MPKTISDESKTHWLIFCPACRAGHVFQIPPWTFNGNVSKPTFGGSMLLHGSPGTPRCHSLVNDGVIQFLDDCTHALKGQTVDLPELKDKVEYNPGSGFSYDSSKFS